MAANFSFGAKTSAPSFGTGSITFGTPSTQPQQPGGFQLGAAGPVASSSAPSLFGTGFGTPTTTTSSLFATPLGGASTPTKPLGLNPSSTATTGLNFGASTLTSSAGGTLSFSAPAPTATGFGALGTPSTTISFGLGTATTSQAPSLGIGFGTSSAAPTVGFGGTTTASSGGSLFGLGAATTTTTSAGLGFGLGGTGLATSTPASTAPASVGLGGIAATQAKSATVTAQKEPPPKEQPLPNEILQTVEHFKEMMKQQKNHSSEIARCSVRDFRKVEQEIDLLNNYINDVESQLQKNRQLTEKLKYDTAKSVQHIEMAQRTHDTPPGLQYENQAPLNFFLNLADQFEQTMQTLKIQIESADKYVKDNKKPDSLNPQDLTLGMKRLHETFVALAGRLQSVHSQVESQKETYLNMRKVLLNDTNNPFDKFAPPPQSTTNLKPLGHNPPKVATGPTPFSNFAIGNVNLGLQQHSTPPPAYQSATVGNSSGFGVRPFDASRAANTTLFGSSLGQTSFGSSSFQLQKPPTGNKRGKVD